MDEGRGSTATTGTRGKAMGPAGRFAAEACVLLVVLLVGVASAWARADTSWTGTSFVLGTAYGLVVSLCARHLVATTWPRRDGKG